MDPGDGDYDADDHEDVDDDTDDHDDYVDDDDDDNDDDANYIFRLIWELSILSLG